MHGNLGKVKEAYPDVNLLFTEGCNGPYKFDGMMQWKLGEMYGRSMINDFNQGTVGWTDWNILLDETGGPNHVKNFCYAPIHGDTRNGSLIYTNAYYYIGHFSKFIRPGAKRVMTAPSRSSLLSTSFLNEDGKLVTIVMNGGDSEVSYFLWIDGMAAELKAKPHSIATLVVQ
jgi:glucosylceramidase